MIVKEAQVSAALEYLADTSIPASVRYRVTMAENRAEAIRARVFLKTTGPVEERKAAAIASPEYQTALDERAMALTELEQHKAKAKSAEMFIEVWRTENANVRAA